MKLLVNFGDKIYDEFNKNGKSLRDIFSQTKLEDYYQDQNRQIIKHLK